MPQGMEEIDTPRGITFSIGLQQGFFLEKSSIVVVWVEGKVSIKFLLLQLCLYWIFDKVNAVMQLGKLGPVSVNKDTKLLITPAIQGDLHILMCNCPERGSHFVGWLAQYFPNI